MKLKKRSCALCKPHKMHWDCRWNPKEKDKLERAEKEIRETIASNV